MLLVFFTWMGNLAVSKAIGASVWQYALTQALHLVALSVFAGAVLIVDLRMMGRVLTDRPIKQVASDAGPWMMWSYIALLATGIPQLMQGAIKEYYSMFFWIKMDFMVLALIFTFTVRRKVSMSGETGVGSFRTKLVGLVSILLWAGVAIPARLIGLFS